MMSIGEILEKRIELMKLKNSENNNIHDIDKLTDELKSFVSNASSTYLKIDERGQGQ